jgi:hypothetical protein
MEDSPTWTWALKLSPCAYRRGGKGRGWCRGVRRDRGERWRRGAGCAWVSGRWNGRRGKRTRLAARRVKIWGGGRRGPVGARAGAVAHLRGPLVGVQGEFLERAGERGALLARVLLLGIRGGKPPVRVSGSLLSRRDGHDDCDGTCAGRPTSGRRVRARTSAGVGRVGGSVSVVSRDGARVARTRRAFASRARRRCRATRCVRHFVSREREGSGAHAPTLRRNASGRLSTSARTRARAIRTRAFLFDAPTEPPRRWRVVGVPGRGAKCGERECRHGAVPAPFSEARAREHAPAPPQFLALVQTALPTPLPRVDDVDGRSLSQPDPDRSRSREIFKPRDARSTANRRSSRDDPKTSASG